MPTELEKSIAAIEKTIAETKRISQGFNCKGNADYYSINRAFVNENCSLKVKLSEKEAEIERLKKENFELKQIKF